MSQLTYGLNGLIKMGVIARPYPFPLTAEEQAKLAKSAANKPKVVKNGTSK